MVDTNSEEFNTFVYEQQKHLHEVSRLIATSIFELTVRVALHDNSKFSQTEIEGFIKKSPELKKLEFGTPEYYESLASFKEVLDHHYSNNRHHPEFFKNGIKDMNLIDVLEMVCDWTAASQRMANTDPHAGLEKQKERFGISEELFSIIKNTVNFLQENPRGNFYKKSEETVDTSE